MSCNFFCLFSFFRDIDKIDDMMQDIADQQDLAREISDAISRPYADTFDEVKTFSSLSVHKSFTDSFFCVFLIFILNSFISTKPLSLSSYCYCKNVFKKNVCFLRTSCWQSWRSWNRKILRKVWRAWVHSPVYRAPDFLHSPVGVEVSATLQRLQNTITK